MIGGGEAGLVECDGLAGADACSAGRRRGLFLVRVEIPVRLRSGQAVRLRCAQDDKEGGSAALTVTRGGEGCAWVRAMGRVGGASGDFTGWD